MMIEISPTYDPQNEFNSFEYSLLLMQ